MKHEVLTIPSWALSDEGAYPCPCGDPMFGEDIVVHEGSKGFIRLYHQECLSHFVMINEEEELDE